MKPVRTGLAGHVTGMAVTPLTMVVALLASTVRAQTFGCTCINPTYPCYGWSSDRGRMTCWGASTAASCANFCRDGSNPCSSDMRGGEFCAHQPCTISHCSQCNPQGTICTACDSGWMVTSPPSNACQSEASFFADVSVRLLPGSGVVALASANLAGLLSAGFTSGSRGQAVAYVAQAATRFLADRFTLIYVYPAAVLSGATHQEYWGASGLGGTTNLKGVICGGNAASGGYKAAMHELTHNYVGPYTLLPSNFFGSHWGLTAFAEPHAGMLGGYAHGAFTCVSPAGRVPSSASLCATAQISVDTSAGSPSTSHDLSPARYPNAELYIMGLLTADELRAAGGELAYCRIPNMGAASCSSGTCTISCTGGLQFFNADAIISAFPR